MHRLSLHCQFLDFRHMGEHRYRCPGAVPHCKDYSISEFKCIIHNQEWAHYVHSIIYIMDVSFVFTKPAY
jgi:hypothetical protein